MTKKQMTAEEELTELLINSEWGFDCNSPTQLELYGIAHKEIMQLIKTECKKFALECVPDKLNDHQGYDEIANGHNMCCEHMLKRIEEGK